ncbi:hypothetical protein [Sphingopyxis sp.]|uniref:hypothetical protein n=1 Tax=Sphingopyxis sp. TaxID=1908224 RepID=UPI0025D3841F|nr:hypothetical protein [Sphingopyxis sp.]MBK6413242.1 hypothetical protein [Sphingopyxis sp.]
MKAGFSKRHLQACARSRHLQDPNAPFQDEGKWGYWVNQAVWGYVEKHRRYGELRRERPGHRSGAEIKSDIGNFGGLSVAFSGKNGNGSNANSQHQPVRRRAALAPALERFHG